MKEWWSAREIAEAQLPFMPESERAAARLAEKESWREQAMTNGSPLARKRKGKGGGKEYNYMLFPHEAQHQLIKESSSELISQTAAATQKKQGKHSDIWEWYDRQKQPKKDKANFRLKVIQHAFKLKKGSRTLSYAVAQTAMEYKVSERVIYKWIKLVSGIEEIHWLPYLCPQNWKNSDHANISPEAWEYFKTDYLRLSRPSVATCYRRLLKMAEEKSWQVPSKDTIHRRIEELPLQMRILMREGEDALKKSYPAQERDRSMFHAMEAINVDGHKWDVWVKWPGIAKPVRPMMIAIQDLYSNKILSWRIDLSENVNVVRLAFKDMFEQYGVPDHCYLDNGRAFASKQMTGGSKTRFRFKVKEEDPVGILTQLGINLHWTTPYSGQSKPIERAFRDLCDSVAKHPAFEGAYTGNNPDNKPENYGSRAVDYKTFLKIVDEGIKLYNAQDKRRTKVCAGQLSFDQAFNDSYAKALIRKAPPEQIAQCMLTAEQVTVNRKDGSIHLMGNRYWNEKIVSYAGKKVTVRFDPDNLHDGIYTYRMDGAAIGFVEVIEAVGFADQEAARQHNKLRRDYVKKAKEAAELEQKLSIDELLKLNESLNVEDEPELPENKITRLITPKKNNQLQALAVDMNDHDHDEDDDNSIISDICRSLTLVKNENRDSIF